MHSTQYNAWPEVNTQEKAVILKTSQSPDASPHILVYTDSSPSVLPHRTRAIPTGTRKSRHYFSHLALGIAR